MVPSILKIKEELLSLTLKDIHNLTPNYLPKAVSYSCLHWNSLPAQPTCSQSPSGVYPCPPIFLPHNSQKQKTKTTGLPVKREAKMNTTEYQHQEAYGHKTILILPNLQVSSISSTDHFPLIPEYSLSTTHLGPS